MHQPDTKKNPHSTDAFRWNWMLMRWGLRIFVIPKLKRWLARKNHRCDTGLASLDRMNVAKSITHERGWKINDPGIHHHITIPNSSSIFLEVPRSCGPSDCQKLSVLPSLNCSTPRFKKAHSETASQLIPTGPTKQASASRWISTDLKKKKHAVENTQSKGKKNGEFALYVDVHPPS